MRCLAPLEPVLEELMGSNFDPAGQPIPQRHILVHPV
jgi:hypothetical protein